MAAIARETELWAALADPSQNFTLFVPTNRALQALPTARLRKLETQVALRATVFNYHVTRGVVIADDFRWVDALETLSGEWLPVGESADGHPTVGGAAITGASVTASNGVLFPLETVFWPVEVLNLQEAVAANPRLTELAHVIEIAGLQEVLTATEPHTFFAPANEAFAALTPEQTALLSNPETAHKILLYHLLEGHLTSEEAATLPWSLTLLEQPILCRTSGDLWTVNDAEVLVRDIRVANGTLHLVSEVLFPPVDLNP
jgi:transforming growth factor-beta-induced protein